MPWIILIMGACMGFIGIVFFLSIKKWMTQIEIEEPALRRVSLSKARENKKPQTMNTGPDPLYLIDWESVGAFKIGINEAEIINLADKYYGRLEKAWIDDGMDSYPIASLKSNGKILLNFLYDEKFVDWNSEKILNPEQATFPIIEILDGRFHTKDGLRVGMSIEEARKLLGSGVYHVNDCEAPSWIRFEKHPCLEIHGDFYWEEEGKGEKIQNEHGDTIPVEYVSEHKTIESIVLTCEESSCW